MPRSYSGKVKDKKLKNEDMEKNSTEIKADNSKEKNEKDEEKMPSKNKKEVITKDIEDNKEKALQKKQKLLEEKEINSEFQGELKSYRKNNKFKNKKRRKATKSQIFVRSLIVLVSIILIVLIVAYLFLNNMIGKINFDSSITKDTDLGILSATKEKMNDYRNIALLGIDSQTDDNSTDARSDCIMVLSINKKTKEVNLFSIFRDTIVEMDEYGEIQLEKINHAYYGGAANSIKTINKNFDLNITEYALAHFSTVVKFINAVGGIDIDIDSEELKYINGYIKNVSEVTGEYSNYLYNTGMQHLDGTQATAYCRIRYTSGLEYKRTERMREVLVAGANKLRKMSISEIYNIVNIMLPEITTNIPRDEIINIIPDALSYELKNTFGFPYEKQDILVQLPKHSTSQSYVAANTLEKSVLKLHQEVFGQENYVVPEEIVNISNQIIDATGIGKE